MPIFVCAPRCSHARFSATVFMANPLGSILLKSKFPKACYRRLTPTTLKGLSPDILTKAKAEISTHLKAGAGISTDLAEHRFSGLRSIVNDPGMLSALGTAYDRLYHDLLETPDQVVAFAASPRAGVSNIVGLGVDLRGSGSVIGQKPSLCVLVRQKAQPEELSEAAKIPSHVGDVPVHVDEVGEIQGFQGFRGPYRPVLGGVSGSLVHGPGAGTLGSFVIPTNRHRKKRLMLSNNHVVAAVNSAEVGAQIVQPATDDGGAYPEYVIGKLYETYPIDLNGSENLVDAALVELLPHEELKRQKRILRVDRGTGFARSEKLRNPERRAQLGMIVQKSGRSTGHTVGNVDLVNVAITVSYGAYGSAKFINQFRVFNSQRPFAEPGDSGSLVTTAPENEAVGLLFAGSTAGGRSFSFCNDIRTVLSLLSVRLDC